jgi:hypothetical protein
MLLVLAFFVTRCCTLDRLGEEQQELIFYAMNLLTGPAAAT